MTTALRPLSFLLVLALSGVIASAQAPTGTPPFGSFGGGPDVIDLADLNVHLTVPVLHKAGRGTDFTYDLSFDSSVWSPVSSSGQPAWTPDPTWGWRVQSSALTGFVPITNTTGTCRVCPPGQACYPDSYPITFYEGYTDPGGTFHPARVRTTPGDDACDIPVPPVYAGNAAAYDGSGYTLGVDLTTNPSVVVTGRNGVRINDPGGPSATIRDRNGNELTTSVAGSTTTFTDTLNQPALTVSGSALSPPVTYTYTAPSLARPSFTVQYTAYTVQTNFGCGISEYGPLSNNLISEIDLPDGSKYSFTYEGTPGVSGNVTGRIASITLTTGGTINYTYSGGSNGINCSDGSTATLTRQTPDGTWTYAQVKGASTDSTTTITDAQGNQTFVQFQGIYETARDVYQGSIAPANVLKTVRTCYNGSSWPCTATSITLPIQQRTIDTVLPNGMVARHAESFNSYGLPTQADDYDYGVTGPGSLLKRTTISYWTTIGNGIIDRPYIVQVLDGSLAVKSDTEYYYDQSALATPPGTTPQWTNISGGRGNLTTVRSWKDGASHLDTTSTYFNTGNLETATDVNLAVMRYNYANDSLTCGNAFPTSVTEPLSMSMSFAWNCTGGVMTSSTDENQQPTSITYNDPYFWRPASENFPDGGQTSWTYNSPTSLTTTTKMTSTQNIVGTVLLDGLGRTSQTQLNSDPQGVVRTDTTYDELGRVNFVWNPYRSGSDSTYGKTAYVYDALNRICVIVPPDGTAVSGTSCPTTRPTNDILVTYSNNTATVTDQAGKKRQSTTDALGRLTQVTEDPGGLGYATAYSYDPLGNLTSVLQASSRNRTFTYDWLSRLTSASNPESGTATYAYDASPYSGDLTSRIAPLPNQTGSNTVTTTYSYDALHRLTQKSYSDGTTPTANYGYDQQAPWGWNLSNYIGRLTSESTSSGTAALFNYDPMGRVINYGQCDPLNCTGPNPAFHVTPTYDLAGNMTSYTNPAGVTFTQTFDTAGRVTGLTSSLVDAQHPAMLATVDASVGYYPNGAIHKMRTGNNLTQTAAFNNRLQPCRLNVNSGNAALNSCTDTVPTTNVEDFTYGFNSGAANNGNIASWSATGWRNFNRSYSYDSLNRLSNLSSPSDPGGCTGLNWTYDAWGNRTSQTPTGGSCYQQLPTTFSVKNQLPSPYQYDAAGNMTYDGSHTYTYDAENRVITVDGSTVSYLYDAEGRRVRKTASGVNTDYVYSLSGKVIAEYDNGCATPPCWTKGYVYLGGSLLAEYANATTYFAHTDHLGSTGLLTGVNQSVVQNLDYLPFGELNSSDSGITSHKFTGDEHDSETNHDHTWFREYSSSLGRWMTPDPLGIEACSLEDPQTLNLYAYVLNNPVNLLDPLGLETVCDENGGNCYDVVIVTASAGGGTGIDTFGGVGIFGDDRPPELIYGHDPGGPGGGDKKRDLIKAALKEKNLSKCLNKFFGPGTILTNPNLPRIDASENLTGGAVGQTRVSEVPDTGRGTVHIDKGVFRSLAANDPFLTGTYLHETANVLAIQRFTNIQPRLARAERGPLGGPPTADQQKEARSPGGDPDIGNQFEKCLRGQY